MDLLRSVLGGTTAGALATGAMSAFMFAVWNPALGQKPPERITTRLAQRAGWRPSRREQDLLASVAHVGFGSSGGACYSLLRDGLAGYFPARRRALAGAAAGAAFGTAVWAVSYAGWLPWLRLMPPAGYDRPGRQAAMLAAHWVYGGVLGLLVEVGRRR